jgi:hypothetical protein
MDLTITLTCEYIFDKAECIRYLKNINVNSNHYKYIYKIFTHGKNQCYKRKIRKLRNVYNLDLTLYSNIMMVECGKYFDKYISKLPCTLTYLKFGYRFSGRLPSLPCTLTHLIFGAWFDSKLPKLPLSLMYLQFGSGFNQMLPKLPPRLMYLIFGREFNNPLPALPLSLKHLILDCEFDHRLPVLPINLRKIRICGEYKYLNILRKRIGQHVLDLSCGCWYY